MTRTEPRTGRRRMGAFGVFFNVLLCLLLLAAGGGVAFYFLNNKVAAKKVRRPPPAPLVEVLRPQRGQARLGLQAMGSVVPAREVVLKPEISGTVVFVAENLTPGGLARAGDVLLRLDPRQYELEVAKSEIGVQSAEADLALEQGQQVVAREELRMLSADEQRPILETDLALRKPQLLQAKAALEKAKAELEQARLDLARTEISAPFNALVTQLDVNLGSQVSQGTALATLAGTDEYWIEVAIPLDVLSQLDLDGAGVAATVRSQSGTGQWEGRLLRLTGTLNQETMMAEGIVVVQKPLSPEKQGGKPLILGEYVTVAFAGEPLQGVFALPRSALREGGTIWVVTGAPPQRQLEVRPVTPVGKDRDTVYIRQGLEEGEAVVVSDLAGVVDGMRVALQGDPPVLPKGDPPMLPKDDAPKGHEGDTPPEAGKDAATAPAQRGTERAE